MASVSDISDLGMRLIRCTGDGTRCGAGGGNEGRGREGQNRKEKGEKKESPDGPKWNEKIKIKIK